MWQTNLKVLAVGALVLAFYTGVAHIIPQLESEVPEALDLSSGATPEMLVAAGEKAYNGAGGCTACHGLGTRAPNLLTDERGTGQIGARCANRESGKDCKQYLLEAMTEPGKFVAPGYEPIMPDMRRQLAMDQIWALIAFLQSQGGEVTVTADDVQAASGESGGAAPSGSGPSGGGSTDPMELLNGNACMGCHALQGAGGAVGPPFDGIGSRLSRDLIRESIIDPNAKASPGFEDFKGMMPTNFGTDLSAVQVEALVTFLAGLR